MCDSPVENEDDEDQHEGQQISENPHQVVLIWTLKDREKHDSVQVNKKLTNKLNLTITVSLLENQVRLNLSCNSESCYHEEERGSHGAEELGGVGGDRVDATTPGQRVEPRLADHIQVGGDVHGAVLAGGKYHFCYVWGIFIDGHSFPGDLI